MFLGLRPAPPCPRLRPLSFLLVIMASSKTSLLLSANRSSWAVSAQHGTRWEKHKVLTRDFKKKIFERDKHTCQGCGWKSARFQEIHHRDHDHSNHAEENLETLCPLCHQVFHLPIAAATNGGAVIWLPEMSQASLNLMCIGLFVAMKSSNAKHGGVARTLFSTLEARKTFVDENLGRSDPGVLAQVLINLKPEDYERREDFVGALRLLPYLSRFETQVEYWASSVFKKLPEAEWGKLVEGMELSALER